MSSNTNNYGGTWNLTLYIVYPKTDRGTYLGCIFLKYYSNTSPDPFRWGITVTAVATKMPGPRHLEQIHKYSCKNSTTQPIIEQ